MRDSNPLVGCPPLRDLAVAVDDNRSVKARELIVVLNFIFLILCWYCSFVSCLAVCFRFFGFCLQLCVCEG